MSWDYTIAVLFIGIFLGGTSKTLLETLGRHLIEKYSEEVSLVDLPAHVLVELRRSHTG